MRSPSGAEEAYGDFLRRREGGHHADFDSFCAERPELATALRILHLAQGDVDSDSDSDSDADADPDVEQGPDFERYLRAVLGPEGEFVESGSRRYRRDTEIGSGGMGVVYRAWDRQLERVVAMKTLHASPELSSPSSTGRSAPSPFETNRMRARFLNEARITGRLDHPGIVSVYEVGFDADHRPFFTMSFIEGVELGSILERVRDGVADWTSGRALGVLVKVCDALAYAHSRGVVHRDLKPSNIMVGRFGEVFVMDWGLAKARELDGLDELDPSAPPKDTGVSTPSPSALATFDGTILGTPAFMPPEQARGEIEEIEERSDIYSVGAMLYTLLGGRPPYAQPGRAPSTREMIDAVLSGPPPPIAAIAPENPPELIAICENAMARAKEDRYASMNALGDDFRAFLEHRVVRAYRTGAMAELRKLIVRNRPMAVTIAVLIVALVTFFVWREVTRRELEDERSQKSAALETAERVLLEKVNALRRSESNRLTARSAAEFQNDPTLALLLALEGAALEPGRTAGNALLAPLAELREQLTISGHENLIYDTDVSPDGRRAVSASADHTARVWSIATGEEICRFAATATLMHARFSVDGSRVFAAGRRALFAFDASTGVQLAKHEFSATEGEVATMPDGDRVLLANDGALTLLDADTLEPMIEIAVHPRDIYWLDVSPDGKYALVGGDPSGKKGFSTLVTTLWSIPDRKFVRTFDGYYKARFSRDGSRFVAGTTKNASGGTALVVSTESGQVERALEGHSAATSYGSFSPDGRLVATSSRDGTARIWDIERGETLAILAAHVSDVMSVNFTPDGRRLVTGSHDRTVRVWGLLPALTIESIPELLNVATSIISPDGKRTLAWPGRDVEEWDVSTGERVRVFRGHTTGVWAASFSPDGSRIVSTSWSGDVRIWDVATGRQLGPTLVGHTARIPGVSFGPRGKKIVTASSDGTARIWSVETGETLHVLRCGIDVESALFSHDGERVATASHDGKVRVWNALNGSKRWSRKHHGSAVVFATFFDDDTILVTGSHDNTACILDAVSGDRIGPRLVGHEGRVVLADYHAGKKLVVTASRDGTARVWDASSADERLKIRSPDGNFRFVAFSRDGEWVYTLSRDHDLRRWPVDPTPIALASKPRELTPGERDRFEVGTADERESYRKRVFLERLRNDCDLARRVHRRSPKDWTLRDDYIGRLGRTAKTLSQGGDIEDLEAVLALIREQAWDADTDWRSLIHVAEALSAAGALREAVAVLERSERMPNAGKLVASRLASAREKLLPDLVTCATIDAALTTEVIVREDAEWRYFRGREEPTSDLSWTHPAFDDSQWETGNSSFGFGPAEIVTVLDDARGAYTTVYLRKDVVISEPNIYRSILLSIRIDDGIVAYFNGREIGRVRVDSGREHIAFDALAARNAPKPLVAHEFALPRELWRDRNVIAIQALNAAIESWDLIVVPSVRGVSEERVWAELRGRHLVESLRATVPRSDASTKAACRVAYLEGRLLQIAGKSREALAKFEAAATHDRNQVEPHLRAAECLFETEGAAIAEQRLRGALAVHDGTRDASILWRRWCRWNFVDLSRSALEVRSILPPASSSSEPATNFAALVNSMAETGAVRINCGGERHVDETGAVWLADDFFRSAYRLRGDRLTLGTRTFTGDVHETDDDPLYASARWSKKTIDYEIPLPVGRYRIVFHFAELSCLLPWGCNRTVNAVAEERLVLEDYDPRQAGFATASQTSFETDVRDGCLDLEFSSRGRGPTVAAIEIVSLETP